MTDVFNHGDKPDFMERIAMLAGKTTYRVPMEGRSTKEKKIPEEHILATALAFSRDGVDDIGPDVIYDMATGSIRYQSRIVRLVADAMGKNRGSRSVQRSRPWLHMACNVAYFEVMGYRVPYKIPAGIREDDWSLLIEASKRIMLTMAESSVYRAEQAYRGKAIDTA